jgi:hypothetical protein
MNPSHHVKPNGVPCLEQAKGLLMECFGVTATQAEALITTWARDCHRSPTAVAQVLVYQVWQGDETYADTSVARTVEHALRVLPDELTSPVAGVDAEIT